MLGVSTSGRMAGSIRDADKPIPSIPASQGVPTTITSSLPGLWDWSKQHKETRHRTHLRGMEKTIHAASDSASRGVQGTVVAQFSCGMVFAEVLAT